MARLVRASPLPVNIMVDDRTPGLAVLAEAGVARVSHGPRPYLTVMEKLEQLARTAVTPL
jgi:2-methylisocitrate lyase-like PEP mutase family enzyme